jgi:hypothetical protein
MLFAVPRLFAAVCFGDAVRSIAVFLFSACFNREPLSLFRQQTRHGCGGRALQ